MSAVKFKACPSGVCKILITDTGKVGMGDDCCCCECTTLESAWNPQSTSCKCTNSDYGTIEDMPSIQFDIPAADTPHANFVSWINFFCGGTPTINCPDISGSYVVSGCGGYYKRTHTNLCVEPGSSPERTLVIITDLLLLAFPDYAASITSKVYRVPTTELGNIDYASPSPPLSLPAGTLTVGSQSAYTRYYTHNSYEVSPFVPYYEYYDHWKYVLGGVCKTECNTTISVGGCAMKPTVTRDTIVFDTATAGGCSYSGSLGITQL